jgi:nucleoside-triphosphatase THEP1
VVDNPRNIIIGDTNIGRSTYLYQIANTLNDCGYSVCLVDGDGHGIVYPDLSNEIVHLLNKNDVRLFEMLNEIVDLDIILIDDIGYLSSECISEVSNSEKIIISICFKDWNSKLNNFFEKSEIFKLTKTTIEYNNSIIDRNGYLLQSIRETKLKYLLNEK